MTFCARHAADQMKQLRKEMLQSEVRFMYEQTLWKYLQCLSRKFIPTLLSTGPDFIINGITYSGLWIVWLFSGLTMFGSKLHFKPSFNPFTAKKYMCTRRKWLEYSLLSFEHNKSCFLPSFKTRPRQNKHVETT